MDRDSAFNANWTVMDIPSEQTRNFKDLQPTSAQSSTNWICVIVCSTHLVCIGSLCRRCISKMQIPLICVFFYHFRIFQMSLETGWYSGSLGI